jgi:flagellar biosynthetic protein FliR
VNLLAQAPEAVFFTFLRFSGFFVTAPFPGFAVPAPAKVVLGGVLALCLAEPPDAPVYGWHTAAFDVLLGLAAGFALRLVVEAFAFGGEAAGTQMGLASLGFFNPMRTSQMTVLGSGFTFIALGLFAAGEGPSRLLLFLGRFVELVPVARTDLSVDSYALAARIGAEMFELGVRVAAPMIAAIFCSQLVLGVLARAVPTLNLLIEGPSLNLSAGVAGMIASMYSYGPILMRAFDGRVEDLALRWLR